MVRALCALGIKFEVVDSKQNTLLHIAAETGDLEAVRFVLKIEGEREYSF